MLSRAIAFGSVANNFRVGNLSRFKLEPTRNKAAYLDNPFSRAAKRFFRKVLGRSHITTPRVINVDKNAAYIDLWEQKKGIFKRKINSLPDYLD